MLRKLIMTADDFRQILREREPSDIVSEFITSEETGPHVSQEALNYITEQARLIFNIDVQHTLKPIVVGSAKLGFSLIEKFKPVYKPRWRKYEEGVSDIDLALVSPALYGTLWSRIAKHGTNQLRFPWRSGDLSDYMLHGWIRPDKFPRPLPPWSSEWFDFMSAINSSEHFRFKKLSCALYHSKSFLNMYQLRCVNTVISAELG